MTAPAGARFVAGMIRAAFRRHPLLASAFVLTAAVALFFLLRLIVGTIVWHSRADEPIRPWMTVGYIGHARGLSPRDIDEVAGLPVPERGKPLTLEEIAADRGVPVAVIIAAVEAAIVELRSRDAGEAGGPGEAQGAPEADPGNGD